MLAAARRWARRVGWRSRRACGAGASGAAARSGSRGTAPCATTYLVTSPTKLSSGRRGRRARAPPRIRDGSSARQHDRLDAAAARLVDDRLRRRGGRARSPSRPRRPSYSSPTALARASAARARLSCASGSARVDRQRHRHLEDPQRLDRRARRPSSESSAPRPARRPAVWTMSSSSGVPKIGTRIEPYSASRAARARSAASGTVDALAAAACPRRCGRRRTATRPTPSSRGRRSARRRAMTITLTQAASDSSAPSTAGSGSSPPRTRTDSGMR